MFRPILLFALCALCSCEKPLQVTLSTVGKGAIEATVTSITSGSVKAEQVTDLAFGTVGRVSTLSVKLGDTVKAGKVLAELENSDWRTALDVAEHEFTRQQELVRSNVSAKLDLDRAREKRDTAAMALEKSLIRAPFDGTITEMNLEVGQLSQITAVMPKPLIRLIDNQPRFVRAEIDEVDLGRVAVGMPARIKVFAVRKEPFEARVRKIVPAVNSVREQDRTATVELDVQSSSLLPEGASADVDIIIKHLEDALLLPSRAVFGRQGSYAVYVNDSGRARRREVQIGIRGYDNTQVLSGAAAGEQVIIPSDLSELTEGKRVAGKP